jgi:hypothetical protein
MLPRRDGFVLYLPARAVGISRQIAAVAGRVPGVGSQVSAFAEPVGPGVAIAWEPADGRPGMSGLSFGEHRATALADGLVRHAALLADGERSPATASVRRAFVEAGIDPGRPARNLHRTVSPHKDRELAGSLPAQAPGPPAADEPARARGLLGGRRHLAAAAPAPTAAIK